MPTQTDYLTSPNPGEHAVFLPSGADPVILSGASLSNPIDCYEHTPCAIIVDPVGWTTAAITFLASIDGANYYDLQDINGEVSIATPDPGEYIVLNPLTFFGVRWLKIQSGTSGGPVNQDADRKMRLIGRRL